MKTSSTVSAVESATLVVVAALAAAGSPDAAAAGWVSGSGSGGSQRVTRVDDGAGLLGAGGWGGLVRPNSLGFMCCGVAAITRMDAVAVGEGGGH